MITSKWISALVALVAVVFGLTFLINYVGKAPPATDDPSSSSDELATLFLPIQIFPYQSAYGTVGHYELEYRKPGHQDYWFINNNDENIHLGILKKSCKCQGVEAFVLPEGVQPRWPMVDTPPLVALGVGVIGRRGVGNIVDRQDSVEDLEAKAEAHVTFAPEDQTSEIVVPGHRAGWVRMKWTGEKPGKQNLTVQLWLHHPGSGLELPLERRAVFLNPVRIGESEMSVGALRPRDLPKEISFFVWSSTRKSFKITKVEELRPVGLAAGADAFTVGKPIEMTPEECSRTESQLKQGRMLCGYRIPVTLQKLAPDGKTAFEIGNFRRRIEVSTDSLDTPLSLTLNGLMRGSLQISGVDGSGAVAFGSFRRDTEPTRVVLIHSDNTNLTLELDKSRVPEYVRPTLTDESGTSGLGKTWRLELRVLPAVYGPFPRDDDPVYRDSAVYLRTRGEQSQAIRLSLSGDALER